MRSVQCSNDLADPSIRLAVRPDAKQAIRFSSEFPSKRLEVRRLVQKSLCLYQEKLASLRELHSAVGT